MPMIDGTIQMLLAIIFVIVVTTGGGLWIATRQPRWYTEDRLSLLVALGTGLLIGVAFLEFLPHALAEHPTFAPLLVILGIVFTLIVEKYVAPKLNFFDGDHCDHDHSTHHDHKKDSLHEHHHHFITHQAACSAVGCLIVCAFFDGIEMTVAFQIGAQTGWITSLGLLFHVLPDGVLAASIALAGGMSKLQARNVSVITGVSILAGVISISIAESISHTRIYVMPFAAGVLLFVTFMHLLPVGLKHKNGFHLLLLGISIFTIVFYIGEHTH